VSLAECDTSADKKRMWIWWRKHNNNINTEKGFSRKKFNRVCADMSCICIVSKLFNWVQ